MGSIFRVDGLKTPPHLSLSQNGKSELIYQVIDTQIVIK